MAESLRRKRQNAKIELERQETAFTSFCLEKSEHVPEWLAMVREFEDDSSKPNPYEPVTTDGLTEAQVRAQLDEQDKLEVASGVLPLHEVTPTEFISFGLSVEEEQRRLVAQAQLKKTKQNTGDKIRLKPGRRNFEASYNRWRELQATYMPSASLHFSGLDLPADVLLENTPLIFPSALPHQMRDGPGCKPGLVEIERRLRHAQCKTSLIRLRAQLHIKKRLLIYKKNHSRHQGANTRSRALIGRNEAKVKAYADCYQAARAALCQIEENVTWPPLKAADIRCMEDTDDLTKREAQRRRQQERRARQLAQLVELGVITQAQMEEGLESDDDDDDLEEANVQEKQPGAGESRRQISWIWTMAGTTGSEHHLQEALRVEWSKAFARKRRWHEEERYLNEETRRLPLSLAYEECQWLERAKEVDANRVGEELADGMHAYALKQAGIYRELAMRAEFTRTEKWEGRGHRRGRASKTTGLGPTAIPAASEGGMDLDEETEDEDYVDTGSESDSESEDDEHSEDEDVHEDDW
uniref:Uncharacterized protein n=1 Tax=Mycena chlorophos TaxID=658473 RepID=A0ABQ0KYG2_MYCCL|nr:predicted protein [Mycena chlorophos]